MTKNVTLFTDRLAKIYTCWPEDKAAAGDLTALLDLVKACSNPSKNEKNTSTAYPTRNAIARGEIDAPCVNTKLNSPTTAPPMPAIRKRAQFVFDDGTNVSALSSSSKLRKRYAQVPRRAYKIGSRQAVIAP